MKSEKKTKNQLMEELAALREEIAELKVSENERKQAEKVANRLSRENAIIAEIGRIISSTLNIGEVFERFAEEVRKVIPFDRIVIDGYIPEENSVPIAYVTGVEIPGRRAGDIIPFAGSDTEYIMYTRSPLLIQTQDESELSSRFPALLPTFQAGFRSMLSVPLISKDQVIGGLHIRSFKPNAYTELDLRLSERVGNQISGAIANARLFIEHKQAEEALTRSEEEARRLARENEIMAEISRIISSTPDINKVYEGFADEVKKLISFDRITVNLFNFQKDIGIVSYVAGLSVPGRQSGDFLPLSNSVAKEATSKRSSLLIEIKDENEILRRFPGVLPVLKTGIRSGIIVPLISQDQVIGSLNFQSTRLNAYTDRDLRLAENIGMQIAGAIANAQLLMERKRAEETLRVSEAKYRQLVEQAPVWIYEVDLNNFKFLSVNDVMCETTGYSREEFLSMSPLMILTEGGKNELIKRNQKILSGEKVPDSVEYKTKTKDGREVWKLVNAKFIYEDGKPVRSQVVAHDITERKKLEEQLLQSQKMEAIGRLAGGIAHDFNNLLTIIKGYSELSLMELKEGDPLKGRIEEIQKAGERASALTHQLLAFSRRQVMEMKVTDLNFLLGDLNKMLRRVIGEDIELMTIFSEDLGRIKVDPGQIEQMILNLAVNARDAMPSGGRLTLMTANAELDEEYAWKHLGATPGRYVMLSVSDTGVGMSPEVREQVFEPFFTTKEKGKGTGLGLSTVYGIVRQSGGTIYVDSEPGRGTTFKIYFPRVDEALAEGRKKILEEEAPRGSETVLVVEDEEEVRKLAVSILRRQGYRVLESSQGGEAFLVCKQHGGPIHLMVTDVVMPLMSGRELAERLSPLHPEMRVLYMSGYPDDAILHYGVLDEGIEYIQKPFTVEGLARKVRGVLDK